MEKVKVAIIGAGAVGLAIAEALSRRIQDDIVVFEQNEKFGQETSSRNSEVIHAGIYYPKNSLKSKLCLEGNPLLYRFCGREAVKHLRCGKLIVSTNEKEAEQIYLIYNNARSIGVPGLTLLSKEDILKLEPEIFALNAIYSESTGIIDSHQLMSVLYNKAKAKEVLFAFGSIIEKISPLSKVNSLLPGSYELIAQNGDRICSEWVINCAGLDAEKVAKIAGFDTAKLGYTLYPCKGDYFSINGSAGKLKHLVYPVPHEAGYGLGVHATIGLTGGIRLGPDTEYVNEIDFDVNPKKKTEFYNAAKTYLPWIKEEYLSPDTSGIRPKLQSPGQGFRDFVIQEESGNGFPGFINLLGIESPGLTSCLAIGEYVCDLLND